jgi:hypothetical protein
MNWSVDWSWWAKDPRQRELSDRLQAFFERQGLDTYGDNWALDGTRLRDRHSPGLVATNGVASLAAGDTVRAKKFVDALWQLDVPSGFLFRYYDGLLYMMSLLHASGRFQIIAPRGTAAPPPPAASAAADERIAASFLLARGRLPSSAEAAAWAASPAPSVSDLLARHRKDLESDQPARRDVMAKAALDAFGGLPDAPPAGQGGGTYTDAMRACLQWLTDRPADYERLVHRAYRLVMRRDAFAPEIDYWKRQPVLPFALLAACLDDWARRNQPGLTVTSGVASASVNSGYLVTARLSPGVAAEARAAAGFERPGPAVFGRHVVAPGAARVASVGGIHFAAAGNDAALR